MTRIVIVGAGHVGFYAARRLSDKLKSQIRREELEVVVVDPQQHMTYQPFLPEAAAGSISPRHGVVPLRRALRHCRVLAGEVVRVRHRGDGDEHAVTVRPIVGPELELEYDHLIMAPGSVSRTLPIPGLAEFAVGFKNMGEAIFLRNHVLRCLDLAATVQDAETRRRALTFVFVGGGFAGVEAMAELEDMARDAARFYPELSPEDMRWVLVEATQRVLPEVGPQMGAYAVDRLLARDFDIRLNTRMDSCAKGVVELSDGDSFGADTVVWTAGVKPHPLLRDTDLPLGPKGHLRCRPTLQVEGEDGVVEGVWGAGDGAQVPDLSGFAEYCAPNAQHAVRQAKRLADNIVAVLRGREPKPYEHKYVGSVASLGLHKGVAHVYGFKAKGLIAWFMHRSYHLMRVPGLRRKTRVVCDWTLALLTGREVIQLGELHDPRKPFEEVAAGKNPAGSG